MRTFFKLRQRLSVALRTLQMQKKPSTTTNAKVAVIKDHQEYFTDALTSQIWPTSHNLCGSSAYILVVQLQPCQDSSFLVSCGHFLIHSTIVSFVLFFLRAIFILAMLSIRLALIVDRKYDHQNLSRDGFRVLTSTPRTLILEHNTTCSGLN